jgi:hypothetical protein
MQFLKKHYGYYAGLLIIALGGLFLITRTGVDYQLKMLLIVLITLFYIVWGVLHHYIHHDLTVKIVLEYVLIGSLGITLIFFLIK